MHRNSYGRAQRLQTLARFRSACPVRSPAKSQPGDSQLDIVSDNAMLWSSRGLQLEAVPPLRWPRAMLGRPASGYRIAT